MGLFEFMRLSFFIISLICLGCGKTATAVEPVQVCDEDTTETIITGNVEIPIISDYLDKVVYDNDDYSYTEILQYCKINTDGDKSYPNPVFVSIGDLDNGQFINDSIESIIVRVFFDSVLFREDIVLKSNVQDGKIAIYNLIPNKDYLYQLFYKRFNIDSLFLEKEGKMNVKGKFRAIKVDGMHNFRDIGGYQTKYGKAIKYDRLFRSGELYSEKTKHKGILHKQEYTSLSIILDLMLN